MLVGDIWALKTKKEISYKKCAENYPICVTLVQLDEYASIVMSLLTCHWKYFVNLVTKSFKY